MEVKPWEQYAQALTLRKQEIELKKCKLEHQKQQKQILQQQTAQ